MIYMETRDLAIMWLHKRIVVVLPSFEDRGPNILFTESELADDRGNISVLFKLI